MERYPSDGYLASGGWYYVLVGVCTSCSRAWGTVWSLDQLMLSPGQSWGNTEYRGDGVFGNTVQTPLLRSYITPWTTGPGHTDVWDN